MKFDLFIARSPVWVAAACLIVAISVILSSRLSTILPSFNETPENLDVSYGYFVDTTNSHILRYAQESAIFHPVESPKKIPWSLGNKSYWVKMEVKNLDPEHRYLTLYFDTPMIDRLNVYQFSFETGEVQRWQLGDRVEQSYQDRNMPPAVHFVMEGDSENVLYVHIQSAGYPATPIWLMDREEYQQLSQLLHATWGGFVAVMLAVALFTFAVYVSLGERVYLVYSAFVVTSVIQLGAVHGFGVYLFPVPIQLFFSNNTVALTFGLFLFSLMFAHLYLRIHKTQSLLRQIVNYALMVLLGLMLISFAIPENIGATFLIAMQPVFYALIGLLVWKHWKVANSWSPLFTLSWLPLIIAGLFPPLLVTGAIEYTLPTRYAFMVGNMVAVMLMAMALADRFRQQREDSVYRLTHDALSASPNVTVLNITMDALIEKSHGFTLCCFQVDRFSALAPYMSPEQKEHFVTQVCSRLHTALDCDAVVVLEKRSGQRFNIACIKEGLFGFLVLSTEKDKIELLMAHALDEVDNYIEFGELNIRTQGSIGTSEYPKDGSQVDVLMRKAMQAVAETSSTDKRWHAYDSLNNFNRSMNMSLVSDLKKAIERDELDLYHQPQIDLRTGSIHGSEVLLRWDHPKYGQVSPEVFVKLAEEVGLINELTMWVIKKAFSQQSKLIEMGFSRRLSINVSAADIAIPNLVDKIADIADQYQVPTGTLSLELTESTMVSDYDRLHQVIERLSAHDIEVSIDDYGTGYSSMTYLSQLPFTELKIDRTFIIALTSSPRKQNIVRATTEMAKSLGLMVVAEGVEDLETASLLKRYGVDIAQGYHYSRPLSFSHYVTYLKRTSQHLPVMIKRPPKWDAKSG